MTENLIPNGGFETDWAEDRSHRALVFLEDQREPIDTTFGEIFTPSGGWVTWLRHDPETWDRPEIRDAWDTVDPRRVRSGRKGLLIFSQYRKNEAGLMIRLQVTPGRKYRLGAFAHAWSNHTLEGYEETWHDPLVSSGIGDDVLARPVTHAYPYVPTGDAWTDAAVNFHFQIGLDPYGRLRPFEDGIVWSPEWHIYNGYAREIDVTARAESGWMTVILRGWQLYQFAHNDAYWDDVSLVEIEGPADERSYHRTVVLMSPTVTQEEALKLVADRWEKRETFGRSADDAGIDAPQTLSRRVLAVKPEGWPGDLTGFFETFYPGVLLEELKINGGNGPPPPTWQAIPVPTLHMQTMDEAYWAEYVRQARPDIFKVFGSSDVLGYLRAHPEPERGLAVLRHYVPDYNGIFDAPTAEIGARRYIAQFIDGVRHTCDQIERDWPGRELPYFLVEGCNELYPSLNRPVIERARDLDIAHLQVLHEMEPRVAGAVGQIAVGNPHETEYELLIPLAAACEEYGAWMGYHGYWYANAKDDGLEWAWPWLAGRWTEIDKVFCEAGHTGVRWYGGEGGAVGGRFVPKENEAVRMDEMTRLARVSRESARLIGYVESGEKEVGDWWDDKPALRTIPLYRGAVGWIQRERGVVDMEAVRDGSFVLLPHDGWEAATCYGGNWPRYRDHIERFCEMGLEWNKANGWRYWGPCLFTTGAPHTGWGSFQIKKNQMVDLIAVAARIRGQA